MAIDLFTRANNADLGADWAVMSTWFACQIISNEAAPAPTDLSAERYTAETPADDQESSVILGSIVETQLDSGAGAICRAAAAANTFYFAKANTAAAGERQYGKYVAGTKTELGVYTAGATPASGDKIAIRAVGTTISMRAADVEVASITDAAIASGWCGIVSLPWNQNPTIASWEGGGLVPAGPVVTHMWIPPINHRMAA